MNLSDCVSSLGKFRLFVSEDVEQTEACIAQVLQPHRLLPRSASGHRAHMDFFCMKSLGIGSISFGQMGLELDHVEDYHLMIFCGSGNAQMRSGAQQISIGNDRGICLAPGDPLRAEFSNDCQQLVFRIDARAMRRHSGLRNPRLSPFIDLSQPHFRPWARFVQSMLADSAVIDLLAANDRFAADFEMLFFSALLATSAPGDDSRARGAAPSGVKRAETYIEANYREAMTLTQIAEAAEVPVRTLLTGFRRFRGISPMRFLLDCRLDAARARLLSADYEDTVLSIALDCGFSHLGRFAAQYFECYGERPSETFRAVTQAGIRRNSS